MGEKQTKRQEIIRHVVTSKEHARIHNPGGPSNLGFYDARFISENITYKTLGEGVFHYKYLLFEYYDIATHGKITVL